jgi:hypothetical protein
MNLATLLQNLASYVDLGKRVATTLPGMVLAVALVFWLQPGGLPQFAIALRAPGKDIATLLLSTVQTILYFALIGFVLGMLLDPLNRALFLEFFPDLSTRLAKGHQKLAVAMGAASIAEARARRAQNFAAQAMVSDGDSPKANGTLRTAQFYIGRGLLTQAEYDARVADYYRHAEISAGMIFPTFALGVALAPNSPLWWVLAVAGPLGLYRLAVSRLADFQHRLADFIEGRIDQLKSAEAKQRRTVDLTLLVHLLRKIDSLKKEGLF